MRINFVSFATVALLLAAPAHATIIQLDVSATPVAPNHWTFDGPAPDIVNAGFRLDTSGASFNLVPLIGSNGTNCVGHFDATLGLQGGTVAADGNPFLTLGAGSVSVSGDHPSSSCAADSQFFFGGMTFTNPEATILLSFDSSHALSLSDLLGSADPLAALLLSTASLGTGILSISTAVGTAGGVFGAGGVHFQEVPEPATLALFAVGLAGIALQRRTQRARQR